MVRFSQMAKRGKIRRWIGVSILCFLSFQFGRVFDYARNYDSITEMQAIYQQVKEIENAALTLPVFKRQETRK